MNKVKLVFKEANIGYEEKKLLEWVMLDSRRPISSLNLKVHLQMKCVLCLGPFLGPALST